MSALKLNIADLVFVLKQIKIAEANSTAHSGVAAVALTEIWVDGNGNVVPAGTPGATLAIPSPMAPYGLRTVDGTFNNTVDGRETWGASDQAMPRLLPSYYRNDADGDAMRLGPPGSGAPTITNNNYGNNGSVADADPRLISNLVSDMSFNNPAAIVAALSFAEFNGEFAGEIYGAGGALETIQEAFAAMHIVLDNPLSTPAEETAAYATFDAVIASFGVSRDGNSILVPNIAPDEGLSAPFNAWMTFFGQFFDHGLDLINKGGNGTVYIPLNADDPLMTVGADGIANTGDELSLPQNSHLAFMAITRATPSGDTEVNKTTPFVDQNQTYTSNASHQAFLREYHLEGGVPKATGHLLDGKEANDTVSSLPTWADVKEQARLVLGIQLTDLDVGNVPVLRMDLYGEFVRGSNGMPQILAGVDSTGASIWVETSIANPVNPSAIQLPVGTVLLGGNVITAGETVSAVRTGHAFLDDIAHSAAPVVVGGALRPDAGTTVGNTVATDARGRNTEYDNELLDQHFITGDGRGNENIGLTAVHHVFHSEHNRQVEQQKLTILSSGDEAFINEWLETDVNFSDAQLAAFRTMTVGQLNTYLAGQNYDWDGERLFQAARMATEMQYQHLVFEEFARKIQPNIDPFVFNSTPDINPAIFAEFAHVVYRFGHSMLTDNMPRIDGVGAEMAAMKADGTPLSAEEFGLVASFLNPIAYDMNGGITDDEGAAAIIRGMTIERGNEIDEFLVDALRNNLLGLPLDLGAINIARGRDTGMPSLNQARQALFDASGSTFLEPYKNWVDFAANLKHPVSVINFIAAYGTHPTITAATTAEAKRDAAWLLVMGGEGAPADRMDFLNATGAYTGKGGLNEVDIWIGGLAEKKMPFGGFLGSTFNAVFELQLENLQDGDRFYYLTRTQGQNFLVSLEQNSFAKLMMANTALSDPGADGVRGTSDDIINRHIGVDSFAVYDYVLEVNVANQADYNAATPQEIAAAKAAVTAAQAAHGEAVAARVAADLAAADAAAAVTAAQQAAVSDAVALRTAANAAMATAAATTTTAELAALMTAVAGASATDAAALQAAANAAKALADATNAASLQAQATQAAADDAAAVAAQALADATNAASLQAQATQAAADDAAAVAAQALADATNAASLQSQADQAAADDAAAVAAQALADATNAASLQSQADQAAADDAAAVAAQALADVTNAASLQSQATQAAADDAAAVAAQALADATNAASLQAQADQAAADDAAAVAAQALADATNAASLQAQATQAAADDAAAVAAQALADATNAASLQSQADQAAADDAAAVAAQALADATNAASLQSQATQAAADDAAAVAAQALADATNAASLQAQADQAAADDAAAVAAQALADATNAASLQSQATQAAADDAAAVAAQALADATNAASLQSQADQAAADDAAAVAAQALADATNAASLQAQATQAAADDAAAVAAQALADATNAASLQAQATQAAADDAAAVAAQALADATNAASFQAQATQAAADDAAAVAAQALAAATNAASLQAQATQAAADDAAAVAAQALATAAANADAGLLPAINAYLAASAADAAADAAAAAADAAADAAEAADAMLDAVVYNASVMADAADLAATFEAAAVSALAGAIVEHDALVSNGHGLGKDPIGNNPVLEAAGLGKVVRADANSIRVQGGEHVVVGGTAGNDTIITDFGDDGIWGDAGDDRIESGAGVDLVNGGAGNDIITDSGDTGDFLKGDEGDDVISGGNGLDIYMGGEGNDVVFHGVDSSETFAGQGNDFVLGGDGGDLIMGNEGDDWLEAGAGFDTTAGDNSELFFDSRIIGHDVMFSGSEEHDFDAESGDDIMVQGESVLRSEGMFGFDWATYKGNGQNADVDLARPIFTNEVLDVLRDRFDKVEAASGFTGNDLLVGDNRVYSPTAQANINATAEAVFFRDEINEAGIARIDGLDQIITNREMFDGIYTSEFGDLNPNAVAEKIFAGNVLIGGAGNDVLIGKGGNDILDGDRWLNVRIRLTAPGDDNTAENQLATVDSLTHVFTAQQLTALGIDTAFAGRSLAALLTERLIVPSQMHIVREILDGGQVGDVDTAVFWDVVENYTVTEEDGAYVIRHDRLGNPAVLPPGFTRVSDGTDTLRNIELVKFGDGLGGFRTFNIAQLVPVAATGTPVISDTTPTEGQVLSVNTASIQDLNGIASLAIQWQSSADGITWANIAGETGVNLTLPDAAGTALTPLHNQFLRSVVTVTDNLGTVQAINSAATDRVGMNFTAGAVATTFTAPATNDTLVGSAFADTLFGGPGNDVMLGGDGNDVLSGGQGNDVIDGQVGTDTAAWLQTVDNFSNIAAGPGVGEISIQTPGPAGTVGQGGIDIVRNIELLRFGSVAAGTSVTFTVVNGTAAADNLSGGAGSQAIFGLAGNDTLSGNGAADILVGGVGNDTIFGNGGDDWIFQTGAADGRDVINGGAGIDTYTLSGVAGAETFNIYARAAFLTANPGAALSGGTEIVITRNGTVIAELDNIEEIRVNGLLTTAQDGNGVVTGGVTDGDTVNVIGDFGDGLNLPTSLTSLLFNTIRFTGSNANDTVNITGLQSDHRIVFTTNGGQDTLLGAVRTQDVINGTVTDLRTAAVSVAGAPTAVSDFGAQDGLGAMVGGALRMAAPIVGSGDSETSIDRTMIEMDMLFPLDTVETAPVAPVFVNDAPVDLGGGDQRSILTDYPVS